MRPLAVALCCFMVCQLCPPSAWAQEAGGQLNIVIVDGDGAINNIRQRTAREPIVQVEDQNHKPIAGAAVVFLLPDQGASGVFANGSHTLTVMTDAQGRAVAHGLKPNGVQGKLQIHVTASHQGQTATATISQTNAVSAAGGAAAAGVSAKLIAILAIAGAAVAGGVVAATRGGGGGSPTAPPTPPTTVTPGTGTVGAPH
ncbi:MAG: hypothetical protein LAP39_02735 [Acidobacteriia bacterium]|nr:hypothetical protein [Terriglobia bacterium]